MNPASPRVLILPASSWAHQRTVGGGERYAHEVARALAARTPTTLALFDHEDGAESDGPLTVRRFAVRNRKKSLLYPLTPGSRAALRDYDILHLMCFPNQSSELFTLLGWWRGQRVVLTDVGGGGPCLSTRLRRLNGRWDLHRLAHGLAHLSAYSGQFFSDWSQPAVTLFGGASPAVRPGEGRPEGYILFVGRLLPHKGVLEAIQALSPHTPLRVVGRPYSEAYFADLQAAAKGKLVTFHTSADDAELARHYAGASAVLQVSLPAEMGGVDKSELLGLVAIEAMAAGKPAIVTRTTSLPELVVDGVTGFVVPPRDLAALRDRMDQLAHDPALSQRLGEQARKHAADHFTWERVADRCLNFYRQLLESAGGRS